MDDDGGGGERKRKRQEDEMVKDWKGEAEDMWKKAIRDNSNLQLADSTPLFLSVLLKLREDRNQQSINEIKHLLMEKKEEQGAPAPTIAQVLKSGPKQFESGIIENSLTIKLDGPQNYESFQSTKKQVAKLFTDRGVRPIEIRQSKAGNAVVKFS